MSDRVRFQADEDIREEIVTGLLKRQPLIEFQTVQGVGLKGSPDPALLAFAAEQGRGLVSHDLKTMPGHFGAFLTCGKHSSGLILVQQRLPVALILDDLLLIWEADTPEEWIDRIEYLPL